MKVVLKNVRLLWPVLFTPENSKKYDKPGDPKKYKATFWIEKTDKANVDAINSTIKKEVENKFEEKAAGFLRSVKGDKQKFFLRDGDTDINSEGEPRNPGFYTFTAYRKETEEPMKLVHKDKTRVTKENSPFYSGCYVNVSLDIWANDGGVRVKLLGVQFFNDGPQVGNRVEASDEDFDVVGDANDLDDIL